MSPNNTDTAPRYVQSRMPVIHQPTPQIVTRPPVPVVQVQQQQQISATTPALAEDDINCCMGTINRSPLKTGTVYMSGRLILYYMLYFNGIN